MKAINTIIFLFSGILLLTSCVPKTDIKLTSDSIESMVTTQIDISGELPDFMELYEKICETTRWFTYGIDAVEHAETPAHYADGTQICYFEVADTRFTELGITSRDTLGDYLRTLFTEDATSELLSRDTFADFDGSLCVLAAVYSPSFGLRSPEYSLEYVSESERILRCDAEYHLFDDSEPIEFELCFVYINGTWLCSQSSDMCCLIN